MGNRIHSLYLRTGPYVEYFRVSFQSLLAYRYRYFFGILTYVIHVAVYYFIYKSLYVAGGDIHGYSFKDMVTYISLGWISKSFYLNYIDQDIAGDVRTGKIAMDLIKPVDYQIMNYAKGLGHSAFRFLLFGPPILLVVLFLFPIKPPSSIFNLFLFLISTFFSILLYLGINVFMGMIAIYTISIEGMLYPKNMIIELLSGLLVPLNWFPLWFQNLSSLFPFKYIAFVPLNLYLGRLPVRAAYEAIFIQLFWVVVLFYACKLLWYICKRKIIIHGG